MKSNSNIILSTIFYFSLSFYFLMFSSCGDKILGIHPRLLDWSQEFIADDGPEFDDYHNKPLEFFEENTTVEYLTDTIVVSAVMNTNACAMITGNIEISGDSIILKTRWVNNEGCSSTHFIRANYRILNEDNLEYSFYLK
jgi:hypothetical protein